jgi:hypothetical protein
MGAVVDMVVLCPGQGLQKKIADFGSSYKELPKAAIF